MRTPIGLDTTLLHAADSYIKQIQAAAGGIGGHGAGRARAFDPHARRQFVEAIDIYLDLPKTLIAVPLTTLGTLPPLAQLMASRSFAVENAMIPVEPEQDFYSLFLNLVLSDEEFAKTAVRWAWFQFLDADVLRDYAESLHVADDFYILKRDTFERFADALCGIPRQQRVQLIWSVRKESDALKHSVDEVRETIVNIASVKTIKESGYALQKALDGDLARCAQLIDKLDLPSDWAVDVFLLAHVGSVCIRGLRYAEVYCRGPQRVFYWPAELRSRYLGAKPLVCRTNGVSTPCARSYVWSWGSILADSSACFPIKWSAERLGETLFDLKHALEKDQVTTSVDSPKERSESVPAFLQKLELERFLELAREHDIFMGENHEVETVKMVVAGLGRILRIAPDVVLEYSLERKPLKIFLQWMFRELEGHSERASAIRKVEEKSSEAWLVLRDLARRAFGRNLGSPVGAIAKSGAWSMNIPRKDR